MGGAVEGVNVDTGKIICARLQIMTIVIRRRPSREGNDKPGTLAAYALAEEDRKGRNILANHRFRTIKRAKRAVENHLSGVFGSVPPLTWAGDSQ